MKEQSTHKDMAHALYDNYLGEFEGGKMPIQKAYHYKKRQYDVPVNTTGGYLDRKDRDSLAFGMIYLN